MRSAGNFSPEWGYLAPVPSFMRTLRVVLVATAVGATAAAAVVLTLVDRPTGDADRTAAVAHAIVTSVQAAPATIPPIATAGSTAPATAAAKSVAVTPAPIVSRDAVASPTAIQATTPAAIEPAAPTQTAVAKQDAAPLRIETAPAQPAIATPAMATAAPQPHAASPSEPAVIAPAGPTAASPVAAPASPAATNGMAALTEPGAAATAGSTDTTDTVTAEPVTVPPPKKVKHPTTGPNAANAKTKEASGLGTVFKKLFNIHTGANYFPSRGL